MITLPRRSVTRFFIPLIDVLLLLFCIFLLMPLVKATGEGGSAGTPSALEERIRQLEQELERLRRAGAETPDQLRQELERLRQERVKALEERLVIRVLEIDPADGRLFYLEPERVEIRGQAEARELVERERRDYGAGGQRELYYLILYPRDRTSRFPHRAQREQYERWFEGVAHGWDIPGAAPRKGDVP